MRVLVSFFAAVCMSVALFYLMRYMISSEGQRVDKPPPGAAVSLVRIEKSTPGPAPAPGSMLLAPRRPRPRAEPIAEVAEPASAQPALPDPPALRAMLPELEPIVPNGGPYLGRYEKPELKVPVAVAKSVPPPKTVSKSRPRPRKAAAGRKERVATTPTPPALSPVPPGNVAGGGAGSATGPVVSGGAEGEPGLEDDVIALLKLSPEYPRKAARAGKEGWVKLEFTITRDGNVTDAAVVDARPRRLFDRAALRAIRKWRFKPKTNGGKAVARRATQVIEFNLAKK